MELIIDSNYLQHLNSALFFIPLCWIAVAVAILTDLVGGIYTAVQIGEKIKSHIIRITMKKMLEYFLFIFLAAVLDVVCMMAPWYCFAWASLVFAVIAVGTEIKSLWEQAQRRKSGLVKAKDVAKMIVDCATHDEAKKIMGMVQNLKSLS